MEMIRKIDKMDFFSAEFAKQRWIYCYSVIIDTKNVTALTGGKQSFRRGTCSQRTILWLSVAFLQLSWRWGP
jgi:hypothetical protein